MKKTIKRSKLVKALGKLKNDSVSVVPFKEKPADEVKETKGQMEASQLFSLFTADIIKEDIVFVR